LLKANQEKNKRK